MSSPCVFPRKRIETKVRTLALRNTGFERRIRFHGLRHKRASWHAQAGTPAQVLQELGGWSTGDMVHRYAHFGVDHLAAHADRITAQLRHRPSDSGNYANDGKASNGGEEGIVAGSPYGDRPSLAMLGTALRASKKRARFLSNQWLRATTHSDNKTAPLGGCFAGGEGGIRTHVPGKPDHLISSQRRYDHFGTSP